MRRILIILYLAQGGCARKSAEEHLASGQEHMLRFTPADRMEAIAEFSEAIRLKPNYADAYAERGIAIWRALPPPRWGEALADLDRAISINPENPPFYHSRGCVREAQHDYDGAIADFSEALRRASIVTGKEGSMPDAYVARGQVYEEKSDVKAAIADYETALKVAPVDWYLRYKVEVAL